MTDEIIKCDKCGKPMVEIDRETTMAEADMSDLTEGQMADYMAAELSGCYGDWSITEITYECQRCKAVKIIDVS